MKSFRIESTCEHKDSLLYRDDSKVESLSVIQMTFPTSCDSSLIRIGSEEIIFTDTLKTLPMKSLEQLENELINTSSKDLVDMMWYFPEIISTKTTTVAEKFKLIQSIYTKNAQTKKMNIAREILSDRENLMYISPVAGYGLPSKDILIPGANRGYRIDTTDGIHHGWDIMAPNGTPVQSLGKGIIIRVVDNWKWATFESLIRSDLTLDNRLTNLDIFRGNQVWLQTMDGNVTFYSHLSKISPDIRVGTKVDAGTYLGNIGRTGVPEKNYQNFHLHFEIQENPYQEKNPTELEIMRWNYVGKDLSKVDIYEKMRKIFQY